MPLFDDLKARFSQALGVAKKIPRSVNLDPSNQVSEESGWGSSGASYRPNRRAQRQPFKWGR